MNISRLNYFPLIAALLFAAGCGDQPESAGPGEAAAPAEVAPAEPPLTETAEVSQETPALVVDDGASAVVVEAPEEAAAMEEAAGPAESKVHKVRAVVTQWQPMVLMVEPGDTVQWTNMVGHNVQLLEGMHPEGAELFESKMGEENFTVTLEKEGAYVYICTPHVSTGMVGVVVVGKTPPDNLAALDAALPDVAIGRNMVGRAIRKMKKAF